ncbi:MAG: oligosaccharide flippase family protein [Bacteroidia bacterium]|nr:oligosaccharide flippase family protein [Bacteroidia bacterium]
MKERIRIHFQGVKKKFDPESKNLFKNSSWVTLANGLGTLYAFLKMIVITRVLGAELFGTYTLAVAFILTTQEFFRLNISMGLIRFGALYNKEGRKDKIVSVIKFSLLLSTFSAVVSILFLAGFTLLSYETFIKAPGLSAYVIAFAFANALTFLDAIAKASLKLFYKFRLNSIIQMIMDTLEAIIVILTLWIYGADLEAFFTAAITARILNSMVCNFSAYREIMADLKPHLAARTSLIRDQYREFFKYIFGNSLSSTLKVFMNQGDVLLLGHFSTTSEVGFYSTAKKLAYSVLTLTDPLANSIFPQLSHLIAAKDYTKIMVMLKKVSRIMLLPALLILAGSIVVRNQLITGLFGSEFLPAASPFIILLAGALQGALFFWALPLIQSMGLIKKRFLVYLSAILIGATLSVLLIPTFQASGAAIGLLSANLYITFRFVSAGVRTLNQGRNSVKETDDLSSLNPKAR